ncbi:MAG: D-2-hydroxyacid dehydrogenase [Bacteroidetes bacterium]|nr:D-2-hydroxyacid dehydrogenase [Bacteroidota bacterium]
MKIVVLDGYTLNPGDLSWEGLERLGEVVVYDRTSREQLLERCKDASVIFTNKAQVPGDIIKQLPSLRFIGVLATGFNIVDVDAARERGIPVSNVPGYSTRSVAQLVFALLLELCHRVQRHSDTVMDGKWSASPDFCYWESPLVELAGKTMGIIGYGTIGRCVGELATAFGMKVITAGRNQGIGELLEQSDVVSIHCPLTPDTKGLINKENLRRMKSSAFLINTSRGPIVVDADLADALNSGTIAGAGIDVLSVEPPPAGNPLFGVKNCLITPHIAWATKEARARLMDMTVANLAAFVAGSPINVVNK